MTAELSKGNLNITLPMTRVNLFWNLNSQPSQDNKSILIEAVSCFPLQISENNMLDEHFS
jgi:hypothetical protein